MTSSSKISPPSGWETERIGQTNARFRNEGKGLDVSIRGISPGNNRQKREEPSHYTIQLHQGWWGKGVAGDIDMTANVETYEEALETAHEFMTEFVAEEVSQSPDDVHAIHRSVDGDRDLAEDVLTTELAAEALADAAGYSDELLLQIVRAGTDDHQQAVVHRDGDTFEVIYCADGFDCEERFLSIYATFPIDLPGIDHILDDGAPIGMTIDLGEETVYRFIYDHRTETDIVIPHRTQVSPGFKQTVANVLEEKWD